jgi:hypothetical protein
LDWREEEEEMKMFDDQFQNLDYQNFLISIFGRFSFVSLSLSFLMELQSSPLDSKKRDWAHLPKLKSDLIDPDECQCHLCLAFLSRSLFEMNDYVSIHEEYEIIFLFLLLELFFLFVMEKRVVFCSLPLHLDVEIGE